jgi:hypothetical protein
MYKTSLKITGKKEPEEEIRPYVRLKLKANCKYVETVRTKRD